MVSADGPGPLLAAYRAGTADYPEDTLLAIRKALDNGADALWLSMQLNADGHPVLCRPADLAVLIQGAGAVSQLSLAELARLNADYMFKAEDGSCPHRRKPLRVPTLHQTLRTIPPQVPVFLDMKSLPVGPLVDAMAGELERQKTWSRVYFYSTEKATNDYLTQRYTDHARQSESRDATRNHLIGLTFDECCEAPPIGDTWMGIELRRGPTVTERFTLGESSYKVPAAQLQTRKVMDCVRREPVEVIMSGIKAVGDYRTVRALGADAVMSNSSRKTEAIRRRVFANQPGG